MSGAVNDQGWNQSAYDGAKAACDKYGYELAYTENLNAADIAAAFADYAAAGYDVIIGHGFEFGDPALEVASPYPDVTFICTEANASADNVASYVMACEQTAYVEGVIAALGESEHISEARISAIDLGTGVAAARLALPRELFYKTLSEQSGFEYEIKQYITDNTFSCACAALCRTGAFCFPDFETKCPEVRCRSPPLLHFVSDQPRTN